jgi:hypothetical protein
VCGEIPETTPTAKLTPKAMMIDAGRDERRPTEIARQEPGGADAKTDADTAPMC